MKAGLSYALALIALAIVCWLGAGFLWGSRGPLLDAARLGLLLLAVLLSGWALVLATRKLSTSLWITSGVLLLLGLSLPFASFTNIIPWQGGGFFPSSISFTLLVMFCAALIVAALLIASGLRLYKSWQTKELGGGGEAPQQGKHPILAIICLFLGVLLLVQISIKFYWFVVWDSTYDPLNFLWLFFPILAVVFAGAILSIAMPPGQKLVGWGYALLVSALLVGVYALAQQVDFRHLTEARAERLSRAIESYYAREGHYPQNLRQLMPRYAITLPEPVILYGEGWCYDSGDGFYRLGYVNRLHWSDPRLTGQVYKSAGDAHDLPPICAQEVADIQERYPEYPFSYSGGEGQ